MATVRKGRALQPEEEMEGNDLLAILEAHGQTFLQSFGASTSTGIKRKRADEGESEGARSRQRPDDSDELSSGEEEDDSNDEDDTAESQDEFDEEVDDDTFQASSSTTRADVVIFNDPSYRLKSASQQTSKLLSKSFMSSKVTKVTESSTIASASTSKATLNDGIDDAFEDGNNRKNDAELLRLVHTSLLSGFLNPELNLTSAQRRKALEGRVLELADGAKLGKGEQHVRVKERNMASRNVREGLKLKEKEREGKKLEEAKNLGNYHPTIKKLFGASTPPSHGGRGEKRERGIGMGAGKFSNGMLKLSKEEIGRVQGFDDRVRGGRRGGRGGGRGGGGRGRGKRR